MSPKKRWVETPPLGPVEPMMAKFVGEKTVPLPMGVAPAMGVGGTFAKDRVVEGERAVPKVGPGPMGEPPVALAILRVYPRIAFCACGSSSLLAMKRAIWACKICKPAARTVRLFA